MSDFEQCSNRLHLDLILNFVNFSCEFGQIMNDQIRLPRGQRSDFEHCLN